MNKLSAAAPAHSEGVDAIIPPIDKQHAVAKQFAKDAGFDPMEPSFALCVGAVMRAWRKGKIWESADSVGVDGWVRVEDRLPEPGVIVHVYQLCDFATWTGAKWLAVDRCGNKNHLAWKPEYWTKVTPLPTPPKEPTRSKGESQ